METSPFEQIIIAIRLLREARPGIGRTHIHKFLYLAGSWELLRPARHFSLYLHGPYSRELDGELLALRAAGVVQASPDPAGYGTRYAVASRYADPVIGKLAQDPDLAGKLKILAERLAPMAVRSLEAVSTTEFVRLTDVKTTEDARREAVLRLKPHLSNDEVDTASRALAKLRADLGLS